MTDSLPNKLSELIRVALADLKRVEADERYEVNMFSWHTPKDRDVSTSKKPEGFETVCCVCLAGAVLAKSLEFEINETVERLDDFDLETTWKLECLDEIRCGYLDDALYAFSVPDNPETYRKLTRIKAGIQPDYVDYHKDPEGFKKWLGSAADQFEKEGF